MVEHHALVAAEATIPLLDAFGTENDAHTPATFA